MLSFLSREARTFGLPTPLTPSNSAQCGARFRQVGHDSATARKVPHFPAESCPTSQRNAAPLPTESVPHFDRNPHKTIRCEHDGPLRLLPDSAAPFWATPTARGLTLGGLLSSSRATIDHFVAPRTERAGSEKMAWTFAKSRTCSAIGTSPRRKFTTSGGAAHPRAHRTTCPFEQTASSTDVVPS